MGLLAILAGCSEEATRSEPSTMPITDIEPVTEEEGEGYGDEWARIIADEIEQILAQQRSEEQELSSPQNQPQDNPESPVEPAETVVASADETNPQTSVEDSDKLKPEGEANKPSQSVDEFGRTVSDEQDFEAVTERETIESDAQRIQNNQTKLIVHAPVEFDDGEGQSIVISYALETEHAPGTVLYKRNVVFFNRTVYLERCDEFIDSDAAQEQFLRNGGPEVDEFKLDPDGDGFACAWNPEKYRQLLQ